jgi:uncharacterized protein (TIGR02118 family)
MSTPTQTESLARFVIMYDLPSDVKAFERHYRDVHIPLAKQLPGLRRLHRQSRREPGHRRAVLPSCHARLG